MWAANTTPERGNFDHHQFPKDHPPVCALSLVLQHLGVYEDARAFCDWLEPAEWFDTRGPVETSRWLGIERDKLAKLNSPIDTTLLRRFASVRELQPGEPLWEVMRWIGADLLDYLKNLRERLDFIAEVGEFWEIESPGGPFHVLYLPRTEPLPDEPSAGLGRFIDSHPAGEKRRRPGVSGPARRGLRLVPPQRPSGAGFHPHPGLRGCAFRACPGIRRQDLRHRSGAIARADEPVLGIKYAESLDDRKTSACAAS